MVTAATAKLRDEPRPGFAWAPAATLETAQAWLQKATRTNEIYTLIRDFLPSERKASGIPAHWIDQLCPEYPNTIFLVEGDGSAGRSLKGHLPHEPVVPASTSILIPVVGLDVLGKPLTAEYVHRPAVLCELAGARPGSPVGISTILAAVLSEKGYLRQAPGTAAVLPLLNKMETCHLWKEGLLLAKKLLSAGHPQIKSVLAGSVHQNCFLRLS